MRSQRLTALILGGMVLGIALMGDSATVGRIGLKAMGWFVAASLVSLLLGLLMVNLLRPGDNLNLPLPDPDAATNLKTASLSLKEFVTHLVPRSIEEASHITLKITDYVMRFAPVAVFAAIAAIITTQGIGILVTYGKFMLEFYFSILMLWVVLGVVGFLFLGNLVFRLIRLIREPILLAFSTASSEAAYPRTMEALEELPASERIIGFVLPMGYSFNLDGSMMYCTFATVFIAQAYNIPLSLGQQLTMLLILMVTSKGMAAVPPAAPVGIAATLSTFNIPEAGLLLIMGIDQFLDMARSATNVVGNSLATAVVAKWEGELRPSEGVPAGDFQPQ